MGFKSLFDISNALFAKLWWMFRTQTSLWSTFMWNKYCKKHHPVMAHNRGASQVWRKMIWVREDVEHEIWWQQKEGNASFWMDNWTKQGALYYIEPQGVEEEVEVKELIQNGQWDIARLQQLLSQDMVECIVESIGPKLSVGTQDKAWWMGNLHGEFTVRSSFHVIRQKREEFEWMNNIWIGGLPFKISFFFWRIWRQRIPTDDVLKRMRVHVVLKCYCCNEGKEETMQHLFLTAPIAQKLWKHFASCAGISIEGVQLQQLITIWWDWPGQYKSEVSVDKRKDSELEGDAHHSSAYKPTLYYRIVYWEKPDQEWVKCNTDGACKENPGQSSYGFIIRDSRGDLIYAEAQKIGEATNMEAEIMGVLKAMQYCETQNFQKIILETYSLVLTNVLVKQWRIPWLHAENIENIQQSIARKQVQNIDDLEMEKNKKQRKRNKKYGGGGIEEKGNGGGG
ncbi:hypothetical protein KY290_016740 [Solanum tuberosum]|uniref:RNase H type-1 domain-containing protein n=1 Tax=Solanum tuberosum TaxID=4113 RepID=A0ABQ7V9B1_SOLTU|nr:hypothetical protein KY285_016014 [Solanum tuberosum]KAH0760667.1 hypothetical protein KY290_016740 [Solanum tuberosum]